MHRERAVATSPLGPLGLEAEGGFLVALTFDPPPGLPAPAGGVLGQAARELAEYFAGVRPAFTVPLTRPPGATAFQNRAWDALLRIPRGETQTYGQLARELGSSPRAVGGACHRNPLPLFIPCHRVVAQGGLGGYSGDWESGRALTIKQRLLDLESRGV